MTAAPGPGVVRAAVDIGTNSMRLLVVDADGREVGRWQRVTGLGRGVDATRRLGAAAIARTLVALEEYGRRMDEAGATLRRAVATSASRDAANRDEFFALAEQALGVRPEVIAGQEEAELSYRGATSDAPGEGPFLVVDIGGGSTELVSSDDAGVTGSSVDMGSVRLTERHLPDRPATAEQLRAAGRHVRDLLDGALGSPRPVGTVLGVAGTWTSLAAMALDLASYDREVVHHSVLTLEAVMALVDDLASRTVEETRAIPSLDPGRAEVILAGAVIAREVMAGLAATEVTVSEHDLLDGVVASLV